MNRKVKAIISAAVAMGYGTEEDYSGGSVGATLEEFAAIVESGAHNFIATFSGVDETAACDKTISEIDAAFSAGKNVRFLYSAGEAASVYNLLIVKDAAGYSGAYTELQPYGTEISTGRFVFCSITKDNGVTCYFAEI